MRLLLLLLPLLAAAQDSFCPDGWTHSTVSGSRCYLYRADTQSWDGAHSVCRSLGANLVSISNSAENLFVYGACVSRRCHIGLNDKSSEGNFVWSDGTSLGYSAWHGGEPNNCCSGEDCGEMWDRGGSNPTWNDMPCDGSFGRFAYVCEMEAGCDSGTYKSGTSCVNCPTGRFREAPGATTSSDCSLCPPGRYGSSTGLTSSQCTAACTAGHYCPSGSTSATQAACPAGTFGSTSGLTSSACSGPCASGFYCNAAETTSSPSSRKCNAGRYGSAGQTAATCTGPCAAGYFCPQGSPSSTQSQCGGATKYCPEGSSSATTVSAGHYTVGGANANTRTGQTQCELGTYCVGGERFLCPVGRYGDAAGLTASSQCKQCSAGFFCPQGSASATQESCGTGANPAAFYCTAGTTARLTVGANEYSTPEDAPATQRTGKAACPGNDVCSGGARLPRMQWATLGCEAGTAEATVKENHDDEVVASVAAVSNTGSNVASYGVVTTSACSSPQGSPLAVSGSDLRTASPLDLEQCSSYVATVTASTAGGDTLSCAITVTLLDQNDPPVFLEAAPTRSIEEGARLHALVGDPVSAVDPDVGQELLYTITGGNTEGWFKVSHCSGQLTMARADIDFETSAGPYTLTLLVEDDGTDPNQWSASVDVVVTILNVNDPPVFGLPPADHDFVVGENSAAGAGLVGGNVAVVASDPDAQTLTYTITRNDADTFEVGAGGVITVAAGASINFEARADYRITVEVADPLGASVSSSFDIFVADVNDAPVVTASARSIAENTVGDAGGALTATDEDVPAQALSWALVAVSPPSPAIALSAGGQIATTGGLDFEAVPAYTLSVTVTDTGTNPVQVTEAEVTLTVADVNEAPDIPTPQSFTILENADLGTAVGAAVAFTDDDVGQSHFWTVVSGEGFSLGPTGLLTSTTPLDFEAVPSYTLSVRVTDNGLPSLSHTAVVTVEVEDVNEAPTFPATTVALDENSAPATTIPPTLVGSDPDGDTGLVYTLVGGFGAGRFTLSGGGVLSTASTYADFAGFDFETESVYSLTVRVTDGDGAFGEGAVQVDVNDVNEAPTMDSQEFAVQESQPAGTLVGLVLASDVDAVDTQAFSVVSRNDGGLLAVAANGTVTTTATTPPFDIGNPQVFVLEVEVADKGGLTANATVAVQLVDLNFPPVVTPFETDTLESIESPSVVVADLGASPGPGDADDVLTYFLESSSRPAPLAASIFDIDQGTGVVSFVGTNLDFELQDWYELDVLVQDDGNNNTQPFAQTRATFRINVVDVAEAPAVSPADFSLAEDADVGTVVGSIVSSDQDGGDVWGLALSYDAGGPSGTPPFTISTPALPSGGVITTTAALDFEAAPHYDLLVTATDSTGLTATAPVGVALVNVNDAPTVTGGSAAVVEGAAPGTPVFTMAATDPDAGTTFTWDITGGNVQDGFAVTAEGDVVVAGVMDWENVASYTLTVRGTDSGPGAVLDDAASVVITVVDVNDIEVAALDDLQGALSAETSGAEAVILVATNLGPTAFRGGPDAAVSATYTRPSTAEEQAAGAGSFVTYAATGCSVTLRNTQVVCTTVPGTGSGLVWTFVVAAADGAPHNVTAATQTSYTPPSVTAVSGLSDMATGGGSPLTISGANFGPAGTPVRAFYGPSPSGGSYEAAGCVVSTPHSTISCTSVAGVGTGLQVWVLVAGQVSNELSGGEVGQVFGYGVPVVAAGAGAVALVTPGRRLVESGVVLGTVGAETVQLLGSNLGPAGAAVSASYGRVGTEYAAASCSVVTPHAAIQCVTAAGTGGDHVWLVTVGGQTSPPSEATTRYRHPVITRVSGTGSALASTAGDEQVFVEGSEFGPAGGVLPVVQYGPGGTGYVGVGCVVRGHTLIECRTAVGTGAGHSWQVNVDAQDSAVFAAGTSYHPPIVASFPRTAPGAVDAVTQGGQAVIISGDNFGTNELGTLELVTYGGENATSFAAEGCTVFTPHEALLCNTTQGAGVDLQWVVWVDGQRSVAPTTNYGPPAVEAIVGEPAGGFNTDGGQGFTLRGVNFGEPGRPYLQSVTYGATGVEYAASACGVVSHFEIACETVPGVGQGLFVQVVVEGQRSEVSAGTSPTLSYGLPAITAVLPDGSDPPAGEAKTLVPTLGGTDVVVVGVNFGLRDPQSVLGVVFRGVDLPEDPPLLLDAYHMDVQSREAVGVGAAPPGTTASATPAVGVDGVTTWTNVTLETVTTPGGEEGEAPAVEQFWVTTVARQVHSARFTLPRGEGAGKTVAVVVGPVGGGVGSSPADLAYEAPELYRVATSKGDTPEELVFDLEGLYLGQFATVFVLQGDAATPIVSFKIGEEEDVFGGLPSVVTDAGGGASLSCGYTLDDRAIQCVYFVGTNPRTGHIVVEDATARRTEVLPFADLAPVISARSSIEGSTVFATNGSTVLGLEGEFFGSRTTVTVDGKACFNPPGDEFVCDACTAGGAQEEDCPSCDPFVEAATRRQYLVRKAPLDAGLEAAGGKRVECVVGVGYGGVNVVVFADTQPSLGVGVHYLWPHVDSISVNHTSTAGTTARGGATRVPLTIRGANFGDWAAVDADCRNTTRVSVASCATSVMCEEVDLGGGQLECRARCRTPDCDWESSARPMGRVSLRRGGVTNFLRAVTWTHDMIVAEVPEGEGAGWEVEVEVGLPFGVVPPEDGLSVSGGDLPRSTDAAPFSYDPPSVLSVTTSGGGKYDGTSTGPTTGGNTVVIQGENFGVDPASLALPLFGGATVDVCDRGVPLCKPCVVASQTHEMVACTAPSGVGADKWVRVSVAGQVNVDTPAATYSYASPVTAPLAVTVVNTGPSVNVTLVGEDFGSPVEVSEMVAAGGGALSWDDVFSVVVDGKDAADFGPRGARVVSHAHDAVTFEVPEGEGGDNDVVLSVGGQASPPQALAYAPPALLSVTPVDDATCCSTKGGYLIRVVGASLGLSRSNPSADELATNPTRYPYAQRRRVLVATHDQREVGVLDGDGRYPASWRECVEVTPAADTWQHDAIVCAVPDGIGRDLGVVVAVGFSAVQLSNTATFSYDPPEILFMQPSPADADGDLLTFYGQNFADQSNAIFGASLTIGGLPCADLVDIGESESFGVAAGTEAEDRALRCTSSRDTVGLKNVTLFVAEQETFIPANRTLASLLDITFAFVAYCEGGDVQRSLYTAAYGAEYGAEFASQRAALYGGVVWDAPPTEFDVELFDAADGDGDAALNATEVGAFVAARGLVPGDVSGVPYARAALASWKEPVLHSAANATADVSASRRGITAGLPFATSGTGSYGRHGELCVRCPTGAVCLSEVVPGVVDQVNEPVSAPGWWDRATPTTVVDAGGVAAPNTAECHVDRVATRETCHLLLPCRPAESCIGNNVCGERYTGDRCSLCADGFYRPGSECIPCPDNVWVIIVVFVLAAVAACVLGYVLARRNMHLAFLSIGVDYFQVLAIFAQSDVEWPGAILDMFRVFEVFNFSIGLTAPECAVPELDYEQQWYLTMLLPLVAVAIFLLLHVALYCKKRFIMGQREARNSHVDGLLAMSMIMLYYLYLLLTRETLEVFNCSPTTPDDGNEYLQVVFEECGLEGGLQLTLLPYAIVTLVVYSVGFPLLLGGLVYRNHDTMVEDQVLRSFGLGNSLRENPNGYRLRRRMSKLYYHFKFDRVYWRLVILGRKFLLAFSALMFRANLVYQLAVMLLVLVLSFALHARYQPYLSPKFAESEAQRHSDLARAGIGLHVRIKQTIAPVLAENKKHATTRAMWLRAQAGKPLSDTVASFFVDYNAVESVLLFCAVLVTLAGIMFESGQLQGDRFKTHRDFTTWACAIVIVFSIVYFAAALAQEVLSTCCPEASAKLTSRHLTDKDKQAAQEALRKGRERRQSYLTGRRTSMHLATNPMLNAKKGIAAAQIDELLRDGVASISDDTPRELIVTLLQRQQDAIDAHRAELAGLKRQRALQAAAGSGSRRPMAATRTKHVFGGMRPGAAAGRQRGPGFASLPEE